MSFCQAGSKYFKPRLSLNIFTIFLAAREILLKKKKKKKTKLTAGIHEKPAHF